MNLEIMVSFSFRTNDIPDPIRVAGKCKAVLASGYVDTVELVSYTMRTSAVYQNRLNQIAPRMILGGRFQNELARQYLIAMADSAYANVRQFARDTDASEMDAKEYQSAVALLVECFGRGIFPRAIKGECVAPDEYRSVFNVAKEAVSTVTSSLRGKGYFDKIHDWNRTLSKAPVIQVDSGVVVPTIEVAETAMAAPTRTITREELDAEF